MYRHAVHAGTKFTGVVQPVHLHERTEFTGFTVVHSVVSLNPVFTPRRYGRYRHRCSQHGYRCFHGVHLLLHPSRQPVPEAEHTIIQAAMTAAELTCFSGYNRFPAKQSGLLISGTRPAVRHLSHGCQTSRTVPMNQDKPVMCFITGKTGGIQTCAVSVHTAF